MSSASRIAPTFSDTRPQSAWVTPSGLSMAMRTNPALPPPLTSTSTSSRPSDCVTCCAISSIFAAIASRIVAGVAIANKKVGFRPLRWLDNSNPSVPCLFELRKGGMWGRTAVNGSKASFRWEQPKAGVMAIVVSLHQYRHGFQKRGLLRGQAVLALVDQLSHGGNHMVVLFLGLDGFDDNAIREPGVFLGVDGQCSAHDFHAPIPG